MRPFSKAFHVWAPVSGASERLRYASLTDNPAGSEYILDTSTAASDSRWSGCTGTIFTVFMQVFALSFKRYHHFLIFLGYVVAVF